MRRVQSISCLRNLPLPVISCIISSTNFEIGDCLSVSNTSFSSALINSIIVVNSTSTLMVVLFNAFDKVKLLEFVFDEIESTCFNLVPFAFSSSMLASEFIVTLGSSSVGIPIWVIRNISHIKEARGSISFFETIRNSSLTGRSLRFIVERDLNFSIASVSS